jgi:hypothetical protein
MVFAYILFLELCKDLVEQASTILQEYVQVSEGVFGIALESIKKNYKNLSLSKLVHEDVSDVQDMFKASLLVLRHLPTVDTPIIHSSCVRYIKRSYKEYGGESFGSAWGTVRSFLAATMLTQDSRMFRLTNHLVSYLSRVTLIDIDWILDDNIQEYIDFESRLRENEYDLSLVSEVRDVINDWFRDFDTFLEKVDGLHTKLGNGATAELPRGRGPAEKQQYLTPDSQTLSLSKLLKVNLRQGLDDDKLRAIYAAKRRGTECPRCGVVQLVPKGTNKKRVVSKECVYNMHHQKKVAALLDKYFQQHPDMHIDLHNQEHNRILAQRGSIDGSYATIDLSSASDSVTNTLVSLLFADQYRLKAMLEMTRTKEVVLPNATRVNLEKFAPMGSACCFPVECITFSAIVSAVLRRHRKYPRYWVYGDDIVVPSRYYDEVIEALEALHFLVNRDKSYGHGSLFTESCGIEAWKGKDVSPLRISRRWDHVARVNGLTYHSGTGASQLDCYYQMANEALLQGCFNLNRALIALAEKVFSAPCYSHNGVMGFLVYTDFPQSFQNRIRFDRHLQSRYVLVDFSTGVHEAGPDAYRYIEALEDLEFSKRTALLLPEDRIETRCGSTRTRVKRMRVPFDVLDDYRRPSMGFSTQVSL